MRQRTSLCATQDKKGTIYLVVAHVDTAVDLKALSDRLGLAGGPLRMAAADVMQARERALCRFVPRQRASDDEGGGAAKVRLFREEMQT